MVQWQLPQEQYMNWGVKLGVIVCGEASFSSFARNSYVAAAFCEKCFWWSEKVL